MCVNRLLIARRAARSELVCTLAALVCRAAQQAVVESTPAELWLAPPGGGEIGLSRYESLISEGAVELAPRYTVRSVTAWNRRRRSLLPLLDYHIKKITNLTRNKNISKSITIFEEAFGESGKRILPLSDIIRSFLKTNLQDFKVLIALYGFSKSVQLARFLADPFRLLVSYSQIRWFKKRNVNWPPNSPISQLTIINFTRKNGL